jgi:hypothetical protein
LSAKCCVEIKKKIINLHSFQVEKYFVTLAINGFVYWFLNQLFQCPKLNVFITISQIIIIPKKKKKEILFMKNCDDQKKASNEAMTHWNGDIVAYTMRFKFSRMQQKRNPNSRRRFEKLKIYVFIVCFICNCICSLKFPQTKASSKEIQWWWHIGWMKKKRRSFTELAHLWTSKLIQNHHNRDTIHAR